MKEYLQQLAGTYNNKFFLIKLFNYLFLYRISGGSLPKENNHYESALLCWISHACAALKKRIDQEIESGITDDTVKLL